MNYNKALKLNPNYGDAHINLGNALGDLGKFEEAIASYQQALKLNPKYSRIAIQNARQKIIQKIKEAEAKVIFEEFKSRQGELVNGMVRTITRGTIVVDIGRTEAIIPYDEQVPREYFQPKDRLRAVLLRIEEAKRGTQLILSRAHKDLSLIHI